MYEGRLTLFLGYLLGGFTLSITSAFAIDG